MDRRPDCKLFVIERNISFWLILNSAQNRRKESKSTDAGRSSLDPTGVIPRQAAKLPPQLQSIGTCVPSGPLACSIRRSRGGLPKTSMG